MKTFIIRLFKGVAMGAANVIPGVSGGTIALITNIYEELIESLKSFDLSALKLLLKGHFKTLNKQLNLDFLLPIMLGIVLSILVSLIMRNQVLVNDKQWLKRMISHHSTALTTSNKIYKRTKNKDVKKLAKEIIDTQEKEIKLMKSML